MKILELYRRIPKKAGEVGIEIEVEGRHLPAAPQGWTQLNDASLRGEACEYVLSSPVPRTRVASSLARIAMAYEANETEVIPSPRQSVHVHINIQDMELNHVFNFVTLFLIFEDSLVKFCGEHRVGNFYCLRSSDANGLISSLEDASRSYQHLNSLDGNHIRYSTVNLSAMFKYGSLEFRSMRGTDDMDLIEQWVKVLLKLKDYAQTLDTPSELMPAFSNLGARGMVRDIFGDLSPIIMADPDWENSAFKNMRNLQVFTFDGNWMSYKLDMAQEMARQEEAGLNIEWIDEDGEEGGEDEEGEDEDWAEEREEIVPDRVDENVRDRIRREQDRLVRELQDREIRENLQRRIPNPMEGVRPRFVRAEAPPPAPEHEPIWEEFFGDLAN